MKTAKAIFDFLMPAKRRERPVPDADLNDATLGRLNDTDPVYRCLMDTALEGIEKALGEAINPTLTDAQRSYVCGSLRGLVNFVQTIEGRRDLVRQQNKERVKKKG